MHSALQSIVSPEAEISVVPHSLHSLYKRGKECSVPKGMRKSGALPGDSENLRVERDPEWSRVNLSPPTPHGQQFWLLEALAPLK